MVFATNVRSNRLLAALPPGDLVRWLPELERVDLQRGQVLREPGVTPTHVYFPSSAIASMVYVTQDGEPTEIALIGNEGVVGVSLFMGGGSSSTQAVVQTAGEGFRLNARALMREFNGSVVVRELLLRYTQALITQMGQTAVCNRHHSLEQRLCRLLLLSLDRLDDREVMMTHEVMSNMLGVRREGVTEGAHHLQEAGLIRYMRGHITVLDRARLERRSCECYAVVHSEYRRLLPDLAQAASSEALPLRLYPVAQRGTPHAFA